MKLTIFNNDDNEPELYILRMQSRVPKWIQRHKKGSRISATVGLRKAISIRVMAISKADAIEKALKRKKTMSSTPAFRVLSCRKFYA